jgi:hypothetical protein
LADVDPFLKVVMKLVPSKLDGKILPEDRFESQDLMGSGAAGEDHELNVADGEALQVIEIKQLEDKLDFVLQRHQPGEQGHGREQLEAINEEAGAAVEDLKDRVGLPEYLLKLRVVDGQCVRQLLVNAVVLCNFGQGLIPEERKLGEGAFLLVEELLEDLAHSTIITVEFCRTPTSNWTTRPTATLPLFSYHGCTPIEPSACSMS